MYRKMIHRYIDKVLEYLPIRDRRKARIVISNMIYNVLEEHKEEDEMTTKEVRMILRELGTPKELAYAYYAEFHRPLKVDVDVKKILNGISRFLSGLAFVLVAAGVFSLVMGKGKMSYIILGTVLGMLVVLYQMVLSAGQERYVLRDIQSRIS